MFMLNSNQPIKVADHQKLINQSILNGAFKIEIVNNSFNESKKSFDQARNVLIEKKREIWAMKNTFLLDFAIFCTFYSEVQKNSKVFNVYIRFQEEGKLF